LISIADDELDERKAESELARFPTVINTPFWFGKVGKELEIPFTSIYSAVSLASPYYNYLNLPHLRL
jgi:hypothetical protein